MPLIVPCTCTIPASMATSELATAISVSLWAWMPRGTGHSRFTTVQMSRISHGIVPPFVSQRITRSAPASIAARSVCSA